MLMLVTGLSGSGKTWLASRLSPQVDAVHLRSDLERKRLAGLDELASSQSATGSGLYASDVTDRVYEHLATCAEEVLAGGHSVIVDATFMRRSQRELFASLAGRLRIRLEVVVCEAPLEVLRERIRRRHTAAADASEANLAVLEWQLANQQPIETSERLHVVRVCATASNPVDEALRTLTP
jgi:predicted kinase